MGLDSPFGAAGTSVLDRINRIFRICGRGVSNTEAQSHRGIEMWWAASRRNFLFAGRKGLRPLPALRRWSGRAGKPPPKPPTTSLCLRASVLKTAPSAPRGYLNSGLQKVWASCREAFSVALAKLLVPLGVYNPVHKRRWTRKTSASGQQAALHLYIQVFNVFCVEV